MPGQHETLENRGSLYLSFVFLSSWLSLVDPCRLFFCGKVIHDFTSRILVDMPSLLLQKPECFLQIAKHKIMLKCSALILNAKITKMNEHIYLWNSLEVAIEGFFPDPPYASLLMWANAWPTMTRIQKDGSGDRAKSGLESTRK